MPKLATTIPATLLLCASVATAQITITEGDLQSLLLNSKRVEQFMVYFPAPLVDLGSASPSMQTFNFSGLPEPDSRDTTSMSFVEPAGQPGAAEFPDANLCVPEVYEPFPGSELTIVLYLRLQSDGLYQLGSYARQYWPPFVDTVIVEKNTPPQIVIPLPLTYGTMRTSVDTTVIDSANGEYGVSWTTIECDGWGEITFPTASAGPAAGKPAVVSCLRATETRIDEWYSGGAFLTRDKSVGVIYLTADGTIYSIDQPDSNYMGGLAQVQSGSLGVRAGATGVRQVSPAVPEGYALLQNYPNPFNPSTVIPFAIPEAGHVTLAVYDVLGREVARPVDRRLSPGTYDASFDAGALPAGVYAYRIVAGTFTAARKMNVVR